MNSSALPFAWVHAHCQAWARRTTFINREHGEFAPCFNKLQQQNDTAHWHCLRVAQKHVWNNASNAGAAFFNPNYVAFGYDDLSLLDA